MSKPIARVVAVLLAAAVYCVAGDANVTGDARLIEAVKRRDAAMVARLIEQGAAVNGQLADGSTALAWAVYGDDKRVARMLLKAGAAATVNAATDYGETALTLACLNGDGELVDFLTGELMCHSAVFHRDHVCLPTSIPFGESIRRIKERDIEF